jgi:glycosyltransferase involved in cell wall biosynthesis
MNKIPLSVFIITKNEERRLGQVIDSVKNFADEIIVVDSGSTDKTCEVAESKGAIVVFNEWPGYGQQKRFAEDLCKNSWLLNLDADEVLSEELQREIISLFNQQKPKFNLYRIKVTTVYPVHTKPRFLADYNNVIRLYDKRVTRYRDHPTWDAVIEPKGEMIGQLTERCLHFSMANLEHYITKLNYYTSLQTTAISPKPYWVLVLKMTFGPPIEFMRAYIFKRHFTGGSYGFIMAVTRAYTRFMKNAKQIEMKLLDQRDESEDK